jgi:hypothetical protein
MRGNGDGTSLRTDEDAIIEERATEFGFEWTQSCFGGLLVGSSKRLSLEKRIGEHVKARVIAIHMTKSNGGEISSVSEFRLDPRTGIVSGHDLTHVRGSYPPPCAFLPYIIRFPMFIVVPAVEWDRACGLDQREAAAGTMFAYTNLATTIVGGYSIVGTPFFSLVKEEGKISLDDMDPFDMVRGYLSKPINSPSEEDQAKYAKVVLPTHRQIGAWRMGGFKSLITLRPSASRS